MKIRLVGNGYEAMNGFFGEVEFKDGVSVHPVSPSQIRLFASITTIENAEDGTELGDNAHFQSVLSMEATTVDLPTLAELQEQGNEVSLGQADEPQPAVQEGAYTKEQLEGIADKGGIAALREIADPMGIKGTSIGKIIFAILAKQSPAEPEVATFPEGQPDVVTSEKAE